MRQFEDPNGEGAHLATRVPDLFDRVSLMPRDKPESYFSQCIE